MDSANFINYIKNPAQLHQVTFQELNSLIETYPYCQNLHFLAMMKAKIEQHQDFDQRLSVAATYCPNRQLLFKQIQEPTQPQGTSDSFRSEVESPAAANTEQQSVVDEPLSVEELVLDPPPPDEIPPLGDEHEEEGSSSDSDLIPNMDIKIVEDASGSQIILKNETMESPVEEEARRVVFLEDFVDTPKESVTPEPEEDDSLVRTSKLHEIEEQLLSEEKDLDEYLDNNESDAVTDHIDGIESLTEATKITDQLDLHDLPTENNAEAIDEAGPMGLENQQESLSDINKEIPFEIMNIPEFDIDTNQEEEENEVFAEEAPEQNDEQFGRISVLHTNLLKAQDENDDPEQELEAGDDDEMENKEPEDEPDIAPIPKRAFKSWSNRFGTNPKEEKLGNKSIQELYEEETPTDVEAESDEEVEIDVPEIEISEEESVQNVIDVDPSIPLSDVIEMASSEKKAKKKRKKEKKKKKEKGLNIKQIEKKKKKDDKVRSKKKKKSRKKDKKKKIKALAKKSLKNDEDLISETLATILVDQGSLKKAIKMYKKLSLIFPEKSAFFAAQIKKLKK